MKSELRCGRRKDDSRLCYALLCKTYSTNPGRHEHKCQRCSGIVELRGNAELTESGGVLFWATTG